MTKEQILEAITDSGVTPIQKRPWRFVSPEKLAEFLANNLPPHKECN